MASVKVFVPMVNRAMSIDGAATPHKFEAMPIWFSLIMRPQLGAGGGMPNPR